VLEREGRPFTPASAGALAGCQRPFHLWHGASWGPASFYAKRKAALPQAMGPPPCSLIRQTFQVVPTPPGSEAEGNGRRP